MSDPITHSRFQQLSQQRIENAMRLLRREGILPTHPSYARLQKTMGEYRVNIGFKVPRPITFIFRLFGLSPGELRLFQDAELGWMIQAYETPGATPVVRYISDELAIKIIKGELTHEEFTELSKPEEVYEA